MLLLGVVSCICCRCSPSRVIHSVRALLEQQHMRVLHAQHGPPSWRCHLAGCAGPGRDPALHLPPEAGPRARNRMVRPCTNAECAATVRSIHSRANCFISVTTPSTQSPPRPCRYHPHLHGSVATQTETAAGPWMIPESWLPGGLDTLYKPVRGPVGNPECKRLIKVRGPPGNGAPAAPYS